MATKKSPTKKKATKKKATKKSPTKKKATKKKATKKSPTKKKATKKKATKKKATKKSPTKKKAMSKEALAKKLASLPKGKGGVTLLSGGNPQIAKGDGDGPVQAYIEAMPGWKHDVGKRLDKLITKAAPGIEKAVRWNSPFYGMPGQGFFVSYHCFTRYVKVSFLYGTRLQPMPPEGSKDPNARYYHVYEDGGIDEKQFIDWVKQAAQGPGWTP